MATETEIKTETNIMNDDNIREAVNKWCTCSEKPNKSSPLHISKWDTSEVTNMSNLFENRSDFNDDIFG
jgi:hypothetical protein